MKKIWMSLLALTLVLSLIGCGSQTAQSEASSPAAEKPAENSAQEEANGAEDKPQTGTIAWHYVLTTDKRTEEKKNAEGVLLAETRYELPKLEAICDGGDTSLSSFHGSAAMIHSQVLFLRFLDTYCLLRIV